MIRFVCCFSPLGVLNYHLQG
uniref:Uncharacterized protein n=1 Tax=Anopheles quadriannulatus TaxID=34691 RepID=A0A182XQR4_ANOQN